MRHGLPLAGEIFLSICTSVDSPVSLGMWLRFKHNEHSQLAHATIDPLSYDCPVAFKRDYLCVSYLSKYQGLKTNIDTKKIAIAAFESSEVKCTETNQRLKKATKEGFPLNYAHAISHMQSFIEAALGPFDKFFTAFDSGGWSTGASYELKRSEAQLDRKISQVPYAVTPRCLPLLKTAIERDLLWCSAVIGKPVDGPVSLLRETFNIVNGNKVTTVPKSAKTDRTIAIEPRGNMFLQKAVGDHIRKGLHLIGINLNDQEKNRALAMWCEPLGLCTIDLKSASDSISNELVALLLPAHWLNHLDRIRSPAYLKDGSFVRYAKYSSMGNGFTFELESLIFAACCDYYASIYSVYGDDLIVERNTSFELISLLSFLGFDTNAEKTFTEGVFYESCGKHYFNSIDVTPVYQKEIIDHSDIFSIIRAHNRLYRYSLRCISGSPVVNGVRRLRSFNFRDCWIPPDSLENDAFNADWITFLSYPYRVYGLRCKVYHCLPRRLIHNEAALYAYRLRFVQDGDILPLAISIPNKDAVIRNKFRYYHCTPS